jgi:hypothetical protein
LLISIIGAAVGVGGVLIWHMVDHQKIKPA